MIHKNIFVFDIETIPDTEAVECLTGFESDNVAELRQKLVQDKLEAYSTQEENLSPQCRKLQLNRPDSEFPLFSDWM